MKRKLFGILLATLLIAFTLPAASRAQDDVDEQLKELRGELTDAIGELREELSDAEGDDARKAVVEKRRAREMEIAEKMIAASGDDPLPMEELKWLFTKTKGEARELVLQTIIENHIDSDELSGFIGKAARAPMPDPAVEKFFRFLIENSPSEEVQGTAMMGVVAMITKLGQLNESRTKRYTESLGEPFAELCEKWSGEEGETEVTRLLEECVENFSEVESGRSTIGSLAQSILNEARLKVGAVAPDIEGEDLDGESFKLSDYRGKVVMLDFWGDW